MNITIKFPAPVTMFNGWRVKWSAEDGNVNPVNMPAVTPSQWNGNKYGTSVLFTEPLQKLSFDLAKHFNPSLTGEQWRYFYDERIALTNYQSWNDATGKVRADFINRRDTTAELPRLMDGIMFSGYMVKGTVRDGHLWVKPGIGAIDPNKLPTVEQVIANNWYMFGVDNTANPSYWVRNDNKIAVPFVLSEEVPYTLAYMDEWSAAELPDPLQYYR